MMTKEQREIVISQYQRGVPPVEIGRLVGATSQAVVQMARRAGCPPRNLKLSLNGHKSAEVRKRETAANKPAAGLNTRSMRIGPELDVLIAAIPEDTRDLTARFFGDPLVGRRALDRRQSA